MGDGSPRLTLVSLFLPCRFRAAAATALLAFILSLRAQASICHFIVGPASRVHEAPTARGSKWPSTSPPRSSARVIRHELSRRQLLMPPRVARHQRQHRHTAAQAMPRHIESTGRFAILAPYTDISDVDKSAAIKSRAFRQGFTATPSTVARRGYRTVCPA